MLSQKSTGSKSNTVLGDEEIKNMFNGLGSCTSRDGCISCEASSRVRKARLSFKNLIHLWHRRDIRPLINDRVYSGAVRSALLHISETCMSRTEDKGKLTVLEHRSL